MTYRAYFFNNMYLNGIHNGIQAGHALDQMWLKYTEPWDDDCDPDELKNHRNGLIMLREFSRYHKTFIILNAGDSQALTELYAFAASYYNPYPVECFFEPGLGGAMTSVAMILPERMYDDVATAVGKTVMASELDPGMKAAYDLRQYTLWEEELLRRKNACRLAT